MHIRHTRERGRTAGADTVLPQCCGSGLDHFRMIGQPEIVVGAKVDHRLRFAAVFDRSPHVRTAQHARLVEFRFPRAGLPPFRKAGRRLQQTVARAHHEIAQTERCVETAIGTGPGVASHVHSPMMRVGRSQINAISRSFLCPKGNWVVRARAAALATLTGFEPVLPP